MDDDRADWHRQMWQTRDGCLPPDVRQDADPDELATFGEYLDFWTMRGGMTDSERTAFWMGWSRLTIAWALGLFGAVIVMESFDGLAGKAGLFGVIYAALVLIGQAVEAVRFRWQARRW